MRQKLILKFDVKESNLRLDLYKVESIRVSGRCKVVFKEDASKGSLYHIINDLIMQMDSEFEVGFKKNNLKSIKAWIVSNIFKIYIRKDVPSDISEAIIKLISDKCIIIRD